VLELLKQGLRPWWWAYW